MTAQEDHENLLSMGKRLFGDAADDISDFVADGMKRLGYVARLEWDDPAPPEGGNNGGGGGGGDFFERQKQRQAGGGANGGGGERRKVGGEKRTGGGFAGEYGS